LINGQTGSYHRDAFDRLINVHTGFLLCELLVFVGSDLRMLRKHKNVYILSSTIFVQPEHTERFYYSCSVLQSVTSRLETSRYRDFSQFFESIGLGLENFGLEKKSRYRSRKYLVSKKSLGIGLENI